MPSDKERREISWFVKEYNSCNSPEIISIQADKTREAPDAVLVFEDRCIGLELTSCLPPKGTPARHSPHHNPDLSHLIRVLDRKLSYDYRIRGVDGVWLLVNLSLTLPRDRVAQAVNGIIVPPTFDKVFIQWPLPGRSQGIAMNVLELPENRFWTPNLPRPQHFRLKV